MDRQAYTLIRLFLGWRWGRYKKIKEAREPPYHFINQNLNRLWNESTSMYVENLNSLFK